MVGAVARLSLRRAAASHLLRFPRSCRVATAETSSLKDEDGFLHWLQRKAGTQISSVLTVGSSAFGRSLFAREPIKEGDCIMEIPYDVHLTQDKLPVELCMLLDGVVDDTAKVVVLLMMVQHLGQESGWEPYVKSLPCKDQMHNMMFWDLNELHMVQNSSVYKEVMEQKDQAKKEFSAVKPILEHFPHLFGEVTMEGFMHASALVSSRAWQTSRGVSMIPFADFLNHDGFSSSILLYDEQKDVSEIIADRNYALGEQVMIRYGKYSNAKLALNFGFTLSRNIHDQAHIWVDMPEKDPLWKKKIDIWGRHHHPKSSDMSICGWSKDCFVIKKVKFSKAKGMGVPEILRAFFRVFSATSLEDVVEMTVEATRNDGRLARRPLENIEKEIQAHHMLLLHLNDKIQTYSEAIEQLGDFSDPFRSFHPFRKEMAKDLLMGELHVLQGAHSCVEIYCESLSKLALHSSSHSMGFVQLSSGQAAVHRRTAECLPHVGKNNSWWSATTWYFAIIRKDQADQKILALSVKGACLCRNGPFRKGNWHPSGPETSTLPSR